MVFPMQNGGYPEVTLHRGSSQAPPWDPSCASKIVQIVEQMRLWTPKGRPLKSKNIKKLQGFSFKFEHELYKFASQIVSMPTRGP